MKKSRLFLLLVIIFLLFQSFSIAESNEDVYVVPIKGEINRATKNFVRDIVEEVDNKDAAAIIFEIDTNGGLIEEAIDIRDIILSTNVPTISYVNNKATSAGVLITIASQHVVMAPNATIGSAEPIPNTEKILSFWRSILRDTAQYRDRNTDIIEAMADKDIVVENVNKKGKLVNLTSKEAYDFKIADYVSDDYTDMLAYFGFDRANIIEKKEGLQIKLAKYIANPYLSSILLTVAFIGMVVEILTPGFGIGGTVSIIGFGLYFGGNILAGNSHWTSLGLFVTGLILLVIEGIVPGFGLPGISGIIFVLVGIILAMDSFQVALVSLSIAIIITTIVTIILVKLGYRSKLFQSIILSTEHRGDKGYVSAKPMEEYEGKIGKAITGLRPSGFVEIDGKRIDAISYGEYITKGESIKVVKVEGTKIFVRRV